MSSAKQSEAQDIRVKVVATTPLEPHCIRLAESSLSS
ncbi:hypothetical protein SLEP1_g57383 [Rubroshorea leprosula]|uniref:Uncharacterized protein n=1 Tax=Rubroshorea leprosula TaxID=152421 RepID=A0AAV5MMC1_9ROSI|nr:hypothetical protein SLEP1_g57383 [Rubroshorea leprosula]